METTTTFFFFSSQCKLTQQHFIYKMANVQLLCLLRITNGQKQFSLHRKTKQAQFTLILVSPTCTISKRLSVSSGEDVHMFISGIMEIFCWEEAIARGQDINYYFYSHSLDHELYYFVISGFDLNSINICHWPSGCLFPV